MTTTVIYVDELNMDAAPTVSELSRRLRSHLDVADHPITSDLFEIGEAAAFAGLLVSLNEIADRTTPVWTRYRWRPVGQRLPRGARPVGFHRDGTLDIDVPGLADAVVSGEAFHTVSNVPGWDVDELFAIAQRPVITMTELTQRFALADAS